VVHKIVKEGLGGARKKGKRRANVTCFADRQRQPLVGQGLGLLKGVWQNLATFCDFLQWLLCRFTSQIGQILQNCGSLSQQLPAVGTICVTRAPVCPCPQFLCFKVWVVVWCGALGACCLCFGPDHSIRDDLMHWV
jgi:hypothetical protein